MVALLLSSSFSPWLAVLSVAVLLAFPVWMTVALPLRRPRLRFVVALAVVILAAGAGVVFADGDVHILCDPCVRCANPNISWAEYLLLMCWMYGY